MTTPGIAFTTITANYIDDDLAGEYEFTGTVHTTTGRHLTFTLHADMAYWADENSDPFDDDDRVYLDDGIPVGNTDEIFGSDDEVALMRACETALESVFAAGHTGQQARIADLTSS